MRDLRELLPRNMNISAAARYLWPYKNCVSAPGIERGKGRFLAHFSQEPITIHAGVTSGTTVRVQAYQPQLRLLSAPVCHRGTYVNDRSVLERQSKKSAEC
jgi:hypothetical protein